MNHQIFVYGTLKTGFPNFHLNKGKFIGTFQTTKRFPLHLVGERFSPWLIDTPGVGEYVLGEVFEVDDEALKAIDWLERADQPDGYKRLEVEVAAVDRSYEKILAKAYFKRLDELRGSRVHTAGALRKYTLIHASSYRPRFTRVAARL